MSWRKTLVRETASLKEAIAAIDGSSLQIALVIDGDGRLCGTVTDGDIRRAILHGVSLDSPVSERMNRNPTALQRGASRESILSIFRTKKLHQIPLVDEGGRLVGLETIDDLVDGKADDTIVVIMAGGPGVRLRPLTDHKPKPLLEVGSKPLIETIIDTLVNHRFRRFYIAVNYKGEMIKQALGDGVRWEADIRYLDEDERMGTAGALSLLPELPSRPLLVLNADLLTTLNFRHLLQYHMEQRSQATVCVREHVTQLPFGVVEVESNRVLAVEEKPVRRCFINAGIYVLDPAALRLLSPGEYCDMTTLLQRALENGGAVSAFPIREFWIDIGRHDDYTAAHSHYAELFK